MIKPVFVAGCKHIYFCCKVGQFNMRVYGRRLVFGANFKYPPKELQFPRYGQFTLAALAFTNNKSDQGPLPVLTSSTSLLVPRLGPSGGGSGEYCSESTCHQHWYK